MLFNFIDHKKQQMLYKEKKKKEVKKKRKEKIFAYIIVHNIQKSANIHPPNTHQLGRR